MLTTPTIPCWELTMMWLLFQVKYHTGEAIRQLQLNDRAEAIAYARAHMQRGSWPQVGEP